MTTFNVASLGVAGAIIKDVSDDGRYVRMDLRPFIDRGMMGTADTPPTQSYPGAFASFRTVI